MYIGDSANLSLLQVIRRVVHDSLGPCAFIGDPFRHFMVEETPLEAGAGWLWQMARQTPAKPSMAEAEYLLSWYRRSTSSLLDLYDESELGRPLRQWLQTPDARLGEKATDPVFFLLLALGAQSCPEDRDERADQYFNFGRLLSTAAVMEDPSISTVHAHVLMTLYLLSASRRNAAFMYLGLAVRAAYALGIHRADINSVFAPAEYAERERAWKVLRVLDMFMSSSLGRPPATSETRDTSAEPTYSASNDLCSIFESTLSEVYLQRLVSLDTLERLSERHRLWAERCTAGLGLGGIPATEFVESPDGGGGGGREPNIGLCLLKQSYYGSIMLLARPSLVDAVSSAGNLDGGNCNSNSNSTHPSPSPSAMVHACVDSAVQTIGLLRGLLDAGARVPKRLPFVINSLFVSAQVLGLAFFGDLDDRFPLDRSLKDAQRLLALFAEHDAVARRDLAIVRNLDEACNAYVDRRTRRRMEQQSTLIGSLFGTLHPASSAPSPPSASAATATAGFTEGADLTSPDTGFASMPTSTLADDATISPRAVLFGSSDQDVPLFYATGESELGGMSLVDGRW